MERLDKQKNSVLYETYDVYRRNKNTYVLISCFSNEIHEFHIGGMVEIIYWGQIYSLWDELATAFGVLNYNHGDININNEWIFENISRNLKGYDSAPTICHLINCHDDRECLIGLSGIRPLKQNYIIDDFFSEEEFVI